MSATSALDPLAAPFFEMATLKECDRRGCKTRITTDDDRAGWYSITIEHRPIPPKPVFRPGLDIHGRRIDIPRSEFPGWPKAKEWARAEAEKAETWIREIHEGASSR